MEENMYLKRTWLAALVVLALVVAACGPDMAAPIPTGQATASTQAPTQAATTAVTQSPTTGPVVDPNDWRTLGSADAEVTLTEYSDFQ